MAVGLLAFVAVVGCGGTDKPSPPSQGFPARVTHKLGTAVVASVPQRIVALSDADLDALLLLGVQPVGVAESSGEDGISAWAAPLLTGKPAVLPMGDTGVDVNAVLGLQPDLVLAGGDPWIDDQYARLAAHAPTTAYAQAPYADPWQTTLRQVAQAIGAADRGEQVIRDVQAKLDAARAAHPELAGKRFALGQMWDAGALSLVRSPADPTLRLATELGMTLGLTPTASSATAPPPTALALDKLAALDRTDVLAVYCVDATLRTVLRDDPAFAKLPAVKRGGYVALTREQFVALRTNSPLATLYAIDHVVPDLARAAHNKG